MALGQATYETIFVPLHQPTPVSKECSLYFPNLLGSYSAQMGISGKFHGLVHPGKIHMPPLLESEYFLDTLFNFRL